MISLGFSTDQKMKIDLVLDLVIPPAMTALWIAFVRVNNRFSLRQIAPQPWLTLFMFYMIVIFLTVMDLYVK